MNMIGVNICARVKPDSSWTTAKLGNILLLVNTTVKSVGGPHFLQVSSLQRGQITLSSTLLACLPLSARKELIDCMWYWGQNLKQNPGQTEWIKHFLKLEKIQTDPCYKECLLLKTFIHECIKVVVRGEPRTSLFHWNNNFKMPEILQ